VTRVSRTERRTPAQLTTSFLRLPGRTSSRVRPTSLRQRRRRSRRCKALPRVSSSGGCSTRDGSQTRISTACGHGLLGRPRHCRLERPRQSKWTMRDPRATGQGGSDRGRSCALVSRTARSATRVRHTAFSSLWRTERRTGTTPTCSEGPKGALRASGRPGEPLMTSLLGAAARVSATGRGEGTLMTDPEHLPPQVPVALHWVLGDRNFGLGLTFVFFRLSLAKIESGGHSDGAGHRLRGSA
jgi:hypothetical protein